MSQGRDMWRLVAHLPGDGRGALFGRDECVLAVASCDGKIGAFGVTYDITLGHIQSCLLLILIMPKAKL